MKPLAALSLCSGIGGLDLGLVQSGLVRIVAAAESDACSAAIYMHRFPGVRMYPSVAVAGVLEDSATVVIAGWPCQPHSRAGKRRGGGDPRELWPDVAAAIEATRPELFIGENVPAICAKRGHDYFARVVRDLHRLGYDVEWAHVPVQAFGAPHRRDRVFVLAHRDRRWAFADQPEGEPVSVSSFDAWPRCGRVPRGGKVQACFDHFPLSLLGKPQFTTLRASEWKGVGPLGSASHVHRLARHYLDAQVQEATGQSGRMTVEWMTWFMGFPRRWTWLGLRPEVAPLPWMGWRSPPPVWIEPVLRSDGQWRCITKALGNAVCPPVAEWVGTRIRLTLA